MNRAFFLLVRPAHDNACALHSCARARSRASLDQISPFLSSSARPLSSAPLAPLLRATPDPAATHAHDRVLVLRPRPRSAQKAAAMSWRVAREDTPLTFGGYVYWSFSTSSRANRPIFWQQSAPPTPTPSVYTRSSSRSKLHDDECIHDVP